MNRIILGCNDNPDYFMFADLVRAAWGRFVPTARVTIAYVSSSGVNAEYLRENCDDLLIFDALGGIPMCNCAKSVRLIVPGMYPQDTCILSDMDMIPLQATFFNDLFSRVSTNNIVCSGWDAPCYTREPSIGKTPICYMLGKGAVLAKVCNPGGLAYEAWVRSWVGSNRFDTKEDTSRLPFSDESVFRVCINSFSSSGMASNMVTKVDRGWAGNAARGRIDRSGTAGVKAGRLLKGYYVDAHLPKPFNSQSDLMKLLTGYIKGEVA